MPEDRIALLPDHVANQIAAGEVVQRPCSIVKELLENAVDAGASHISVVIEDGGMSSIQVVDDGIGMSPGDAQRSFLRHATSKIRKAEDLFALHTFGFRGEALASIAAVAQVTLRSRRSSDELAVQITLGGSSAPQTESVAAPVGTSILVRNLFFNIPARRKFVKSASYEARLALVEFQRVVLVNPDISFFFNNLSGKTSVQIDGSNLHQRIVAITTKAMGAKLLPLDVDTPVVRLSGYIGTQSAARKGSSEQYFFVNGRYMNSPYLQKSVVQGYGKLLPDGVLPSYFIYIEIDPSRLDVNISPTKTQVKFLDDQVIWQVLHSAVRQTLGRHNIVPTLDFTDQTQLNIPVYDSASAGTGLPLSMPSSGSHNDYNPFKSYDTKSWDSPSSSSSSSRSPFVRNDIDPEQAPFTEMIPPELLGVDYQDLQQFENGRSDSQPTPTESHSELHSEPRLDYNFASSSDYEILADIQVPTQGVFDMEIELSQDFLVYSSRYIITTTVDGIVIIDYPRALGRIAYEQALSGSDSQACGQRLLHPHTLSLSTQDYMLLSENMDELSALGFEISSLSGSDIAVYALPEGLQGRAGDVESVVDTLLYELREQGTSLASSAKERLARSLCRSYYNPRMLGGGTLSKTEAAHIFASLMSCDEPSYTPESLPIIEVISPEELLKRLKK